MEEDRKLAASAVATAEGQPASAISDATKVPAAQGVGASSTLGMPGYPSHATLLGVQVSYRAYVLFLLTVVYLINFVDRQIISILLPFIKDEFQVSDTWLGLLSGLA